MKRNKGNEMGVAEEDEFHHRKLAHDSIAADHPCVPRKLRSDVKKRNDEESTSPTLSEAKTSSIRVKRIKLKKDVPKKRSRKQSTAMAAPITKDEEEVVETLNALAGIFSVSSSPPPPPPPAAAASSSPPQMLAIKAIDKTPIQFQCSPNNSIFNTTTTQELIIQADENKGVLLHPCAVVHPSSSITRDSTTHDKKTLLKRCATHVYLTHFIKHELQFEIKEGKMDGETSRTFNSQVSQKPKLDLLSLSVGGGMEAYGSNNKQAHSVVNPEDHYIRSSFFDQILGNGDQQQVQQQQFWTTHLTGKNTFDVLRWQGGGTEPDVSQMWCSRTTGPPFHFDHLSSSKLSPLYDQQIPSLSSSGYQDKVTMAFLPDIPLSLQLLCGERP